MIIYLLPCHAVVVSPLSNIVGYFVNVYPMPNVSVVCLLFVFAGFFTAAHLSVCPRFSPNRNCEGMLGSVQRQAKQAKQAFVFTLFACMFLFCLLWFANDVLCQFCCC